MRHSTVIDRIIGSRIQRQRMRQGLDAEDLAARIGVTAREIFEYEGGLKRIDPRTMIRICQSLRVNVGYFFKPWTDRQRAKGVTDPVELAAE